MMKKNLILISLLIVLVIVIGILAVYFIQKPKEGSLPSFSENVSQKSAEVFSLCKNFKLVEGEISCEKAIEIVKENFEGKIVSVEKKYNFPLYFVKLNGKEVAYLSLPSFPKNAAVEFGNLPQPEFSQRNVSFWLIEIEKEVKILPEFLPEEVSKEIKEKIQKEPVKEKEAIIIDLYTGKIL